MTRWGFSVPVEFLTDAQAAAYGCYARPPSVAELDRCFLLDDKAVGADNPVTSCDLHVFVDEAAEPVSS